MRRTIRAAGKEAICGYSPRDSKRRLDGGNDKASFLLNLGRDLCRSVWTDREKEYLIFVI